MFYAGEDTPSPQVGSPKEDSDSPPLNQPTGDPVEGREEEEGRGEGGGKEEEAAKEGGVKGEDASRSEGVVQFVVSDLANLESQLSDPVMIRNVPWYELYDPWLQH